MGDTPHTMRLALSDGQCSALCRDATRNVPSVYPLTCFVPMQSNLNAAHSASSLSHQDLGGGAGCVVSGGNLYASKHRKSPQCESLPPGGGPDVRTGSEPGARGST